MVVAPVLVYGAIKGASVSPVDAKAVMTLVIQSRNKRQLAVIFAVVHAFVVSALDCRDGYPV